MIGLLATLGTSVWGTSRALQDPGIVTTQPTAEDAARAQQKLFRLVRGPGRDPVVVSEAELNAFVSRNVDRRDLPFDEPVILLGDGDRIDIVGRTTLGRLLAESSLGLGAGLLPARWSALPIWLQVQSRSRFERQPRPQLRLNVHRVTIGQQRVPATLLRLLVEPARLRFVRVPLPDTVADVRIQSGRAVIRPTSRERI